MSKFLKHVNWYGALFLLVTPPAAALATFFYLKQSGFQWQIWLLAAVFYTLTAGSTTGGYHRLYSHCTYQARPWLKWFWALFGAAAFQNSILVWARDHRMHHRFIDTDQDPYSIKKGFWFAHMGWMLTKESCPTPKAPYGRDLERDPVVRLQDKYYVPIAFAMGFGLPALLGYFLGSALGGFAIAGLVRVVAVHHATFFINSWCHYFGRQTYTDKNTARDSVLMALATFGEGYHNFHHIFAEDYRNGIRWYHWDPTKWMIQFFRLTGGAHSLKRTPWSDIIRLQLEMDEKRLKTHLDSKWQAQFQIQLDNLKAQIESAQRRFEELRAEYKSIAASYAQSSLERLEELKFQARMARIEFKAALQQWRAYNSFLLAAATV
jgi:stearoyl-CoA desaturase (delta-9 desaturase)